MLAQIGCQALPVPLPRAEAAIRSRLAAWLSSRPSRPPEPPAPSATPWLGWDAWVSFPELADDPERPAPSGPRTGP